MSGGSKKVTVGYKYYLGMHMVLCHGPVDMITRAYVDNRLAWAGDSSSGIALDKPEIFGGEDREGGVSGNIDVASGGPTQSVNNYLLSKLGEFTPAFRGVLSLIFRQTYLGMNPYLKPWKFRTRRIDVRQDGIAQWYPEKAAIRPISGSADTSWPSTVTTNLATNLKLNGTTDCAASGEFSPEVGESFLGLDPSDKITISKVPGNPDLSDENSEQAWSIWGSDEAAPDGNPWTNRFYVTYDDYKDETTDIFNGGFHSSPSVAESAFGDVLLTGSTEYYVWLRDGGLTTDNRGNLLINVDKTSTITNLLAHDDMNPAHIVRECLTDPDWGLGYPETSPGDSFTQAADTLYDEKMGMSLIWDREMPLEGFVQEVLRHIDATLFVDKSSGKFTLKLIRDDVEESLLPILDTSNISKVTNYKVTDPGDLVNRVNVNYWDAGTGETASVSAEDISAVQSYGSVVSTTIQYPGFTNAQIASRVAERDLKALSTPLLSCIIEADRNAADLNIGDAFKFIWPKKHSGYVVMRVNDISYGDGINNKIKITCSQDVYSLPDTSSLGDEESGWKDPIVSPVATDIRIVEEATYYELMRSMGQGDLDSLLTDDPDAGFVSTTCSRIESGINYSCFIDSGTGYENSHKGDFSPTVTMPSADPTETVFQVTNVVDDGFIEIGTYAHWGDELVVINGWSNPTLTLGRGILDAVPYKHENPESLVFSDLFLEGSETQYVASESLGVKIRPMTGQGLLPLSDSPEDIIQMNSRAIRPYPPGGFKINTVPFNPVIGGSDALATSWSHRDRTQQTSGNFEDQSSGDIGPEAGTTYTLRVYGESDTLIRTEGNIAVTSYTYATADESADSELPAEEYPPLPEPKYAWSLRKVVGSYAGNAIRVRRSSDNTEQDIGFDGAGLLDETALSTFVGASDGFVVTFYDQGGLANLTQSTASLQPKIVDAGTVIKVGGKAALLGDGVDDVLTSADLTSPVLENNSTVALAFVSHTEETLAGIFAEQANITDNKRIAIYSDRRSTLFRHSFYGPDGSGTPSSFLSQQPASTKRQYTWIHSGNDILSRAEGSEVETNTSTDVFPEVTHFEMFRQWVGEIYFPGHIFEALIYDTSLAGSDLGNLESNQKRFYDGTSNFRLNGRLRVELESERDGYTSFRKYNHEILREGYGFNYGKLYGGGN